MKSVCLAFVVLLLLGGCGPKPAPPAAPLPVARPPSAAGEAPKPEAPQPGTSPAEPAPVAAPAATGATTEFAKSGGVVLLDDAGNPVPAGPSAGELATSANLAAYNRILQAWIYRTSAKPDTMEDFKNYPGIPQPPKAPPGTKLIWNRAKSSVELSR